MENVSSSVTVGDLISLWQSTEVIPKVELAYVSGYYRGFPEFRVLHWGARSTFMHPEEDHTALPYINEYKKLHVVSWDVIHDEDHEGVNVTLHIVINIDEYTRRTTPQNNEG